VSETKMITRGQRRLIPFECQRISMEGSQLPHRLLLAWTQPKQNEPKATPSSPHDLLLLLLLYLNRSLSTIHVKKQNKNKNFENKNQTIEPWTR
jgi:hypothetical protein